MRSEAVLKMIEDNPGIDTRRMAELVVGQPYDTMDRTTRRGALGEISSKTSRLRKQGYIFNDGGKPPRWWPAKSITPEGTDGHPHKIFAEYHGHTRPLVDICREEGANYTRVYFRIRRGWTVEEALTVPKGVKLADYRRQNGGIE